MDVVEASSAWEGVRLQEPPNTRLAYRKGWMRRGKLSTREAVVLCYVIKCDQSVSGGARPVVRNDTHAGSVCEFASHSVCSFIPLHASVGWGPYELH